jgi:hypothetical protein
MGKIKQQPLVVLIFLYTDQKYLFLLKLLNLKSYQQHKPRNQEVLQSPSLHDELKQHVQYLLQYYIS